MTGNEVKKYDLIIVGGGVSGTAVLYTLSKYSNLKSVCIIEKYNGFGKVNSSHLMNSQTLHFGDIETNYTFEKAKNVKLYADMVKNFLEYENVINPSEKIFSKYSKMVLAVGSQQVQVLRERFKTFGTLFPNLRQIEKEEIGNMEPRVIEGRDPNQELFAMVTEDGYTVDFGKLSRTFVDHAKKLNPDISIHLSIKLEKIEDLKSHYRLQTNHGIFESNAVVIASGGHSIKIAKSLGYGKIYSILSMAGSFYTSHKVLNGKVYTMQEEKLPFAAIHGDPEVHNPNITRFGPTAKAVFLLERYKYSSFFEYMSVFGFNFRTVFSLLNIVSDTVVLKYLLHNFVYDLPFIGKRAFLKEVKKIVPEIKLHEIHYAKHVGGTRPQIINNKTRKLEMGEAKLTGRNIIFNITPSPGASTCLGNAFADSKQLMEFFEGKYSFDSEAFERDLVQTGKISQV
jgi:malate dehydrogenase (quinone)